MSSGPSRRRRRGAGRAHIRERRNEEEGSGEGGPHPEDVHKLQKESQQGGFNAQAPILSIKGGVQAVTSHSPRRGTALPGQGAPWPGGEETLADGA